MKKLLVIACATLGILTGVMVSATTPETVSTAQSVKLMSDPNPGG